MARPLGHSCRCRESALQPWEGWYYAEPLRVGRCRPCPRKRRRGACTCHWRRRQAQIGRLKLGGLASPLLPPAQNDERRTDHDGPSHQDFREDELERETGVEPATLSLGS